VRVKGAGVDWVGEGFGKEMSKTMLLLKVVTHVDWTVKALALAYRGRVGGFSFSHINGIYSTVC
jgi:hypothetical protein